MDSLLKRLERDINDVGRRFALARLKDSYFHDDSLYLRGELAGLARAISYIGGMAIDQIERNAVDRQVERDS
jgi:hypothetical protein